jgi:hypothetical protein
LFDIRRCTPSLGRARIAASPKYQCNRPRSTPFEAIGSANTRAGTRLLQRKEAEQATGPLRDGGLKEGAFYKYRNAI